MKVFLIIGSVASGENWDLLPERRELIWGSFDQYRLLNGCHRDWMESAMAEQGQRSPFRDWILLQLLVRSVVNLNFVSFFFALASRANASWSVPAGSLTHSSPCNRLQNDWMHSRWLISSQSWNGPMLRKCPVSQQSIDIIKIRVNNRIERTDTHSETLRTGRNNHRLLCGKDFFSISIFTLKQHILFSTYSLCNSWKSFAKLSG
jgi:hypothetical protein